MDNVRLDSFGGLIKNQERRFKDQRAAYRELLLLTTGQVHRAFGQHTAFMQDGDAPRD